jgi:hypothetical protein
MTPTNATVRLLAFCAALLMAGDCLALRLSG